MADGDITEDDTVLQTWFERDRKHVCLSQRTSTGDAGATIVEWWDGAVTEAVEDGFLDPRDYHGGAFAYARDNGLLKPDAKTLTIKEAPKGIAVASEAKGVYMGWRNGGASIWSTEATEAELSKGAYAFDSEDQARDSFGEDADEGPDDLSYFEVELDVTPDGMRSPSRASLDSCENAGVVLPAAAPKP